MKTIINYTQGTDGGSADMSNYVLKTDIENDVVSIAVFNASVTAELRNGESYNWTVDNVSHATSADSATKATTDAKGYDIVKSYTRANSIATSITGTDDTINVTYTKNTNGVYTTIGEKITIDNVAHALTADAATKATMDGDENVISKTYAKTANLATVATTGSYNDLKDKPTDTSGYTLPIASASVLGGVKLGSDVSVSDDGVLSVSHATKAEQATIATHDGNGKEITSTYATMDEVDNKLMKGGFVTGFILYDGLNEIHYTCYGDNGAVERCFTVPYAKKAGNAEYATQADSATRDGEGNTITTTYATIAKVQEMIDAITSADGKEY